MPRIIPIAILRQVIMRIEANISNRQIAADLQVISRKTVASYRKLLATHKIDSAMNLSDDQLYEIFSKPTSRRSKGPNLYKQAILDQLDYFTSELKRTGVTLQLLWEEFIKGQPEEGLCSYSTFCRVLSPHLRKASVSYRNPPYDAGDMLMIDFAGKKISYTDRLSGKEVSCVVFVAILANSKYSFVEVIPNANTGFVIQALTNALRFFGGAPKTVLTDNMAQLVKKADRYEASFTDAAIEWANHYNVFLKATRIASPKDKPDIERLVRLTYERVFAPLRNCNFYSLNELRSSVRTKLNEHNNRKFSAKSYSRSDAFETDERPFLSALPDTHFELSKVAHGKVQKNYHILLGEDKHYYSVPYKHVGERLDIRYTATAVEIYKGPDPLPVAIHPRDSQPGEYTTNKDHMPESHLAYTESKGWTGNDFILKAGIFGPFTVQCVEHILKSRKVEQQTYRSCMGLITLGFAKKYGSIRLESACELACELNHISYIAIKGLLEKKRDVLYVSFKQKGKTADNIIPLVHENLRGWEAFEK